jgi:membrane fusion protein (multidrug efflux system)
MDERDAGDELRDPEAGADVALRQENRLSPNPEKQTEKPAEKSEKSTSFLRRHPYWVALAVLLIAAAGIMATIWWLNARHFETTDDAFIEARPYAVSPKIAGYLVDVPVTDNQKVGRGAILAQIDRRDYQNALQQADAAVTEAQAAITNVEAQIAAQQTQVASAQAQVNQAQANLQFAQQQQNRARQLLRNGAGTVQQAQQNDTTLRQDQSQLHQAEDSVAAATKQIEVLDAQKQSAQSNLAQQQAARDQAALNLSYTTITAADPGSVAQLTAARGQYVQPGQNLMMFVPDGMWLVANFKETQITDMRPDQPVEVYLDAYPGRPLRGRVASIQEGSGTAYSLLPTENATGNYVKVVQRVPVKITLDEVPSDMVLGPGLSVEPYVRVR